MSENRNHINMKTINYDEILMIELCQHLTSQQKMGKSVKDTFSGYLQQITFFRKKIKSVAVHLCSVWQQAYRILSDTMNKGNERSRGQMKLQRLCTTLGGSKLPVQYGSVAGDAWTSCNWTAEK